VFKHILIATDGSELAERAAWQGIELARIHGADYEKSAIDTAASILPRIVEMAKSAGVQCQTVHVMDHFPDEGIIAAAKDNACDVIVMASHGRRGLARFLLGSVASRVVALSPVPVLICRSSS
jgi:nucleotide-binding universal stress UspA family protein